MAERNELRGFFRGHDAGDSCCCHHVAFRERVPLDGGESLRAPPYRAFGAGGAGSVLFRADIHHSRAPFSVEMREILHFSVVASSRISFAAMICGLTFPLADVCARRTASTALLADAAAA